MKVVFDPVVHFLQQNFLLFQGASNRSVNPFSVRNVVGNRTDFRVPLRAFNRVQEQLQPTAILLFSCAKAPFKSLWSPSQRSVETVFYIKTIPVLTVFHHLRQTAAQLKWGGLLIVLIWNQPIHKVSIAACDIESCLCRPNDEVLTRLYNGPHSGGRTSQSRLCCNPLFNLLSQQLIGLLGDLCANALLHQRVAIGHV